MNGKTFQSKEALFHGGLILAFGYKLLHFVSADAVELMLEISNATEHQKVQLLSLCSISKGRKSVTCGHTRLTC